MNDSFRVRAPHVRERGHLDDVAFHQLRRALVAEHLVKRVEQGAEVGIDLLLEVAGEEAEPLARLHRGAHQHDTGDPVGFQGLHRARHREIRLAGAGRSDAEVDVVGADRAQISGLVASATPHHAAPDLHRLAFAGVRAETLFDLRLLQGQMDTLGGQRLLAVVAYSLRMISLAASTGAGSPSTWNTLPRVMISTPSRCSS